MIDRFFIQFFYGTYIIRIEKMKQGDHKDTWKTPWYAYSFHTYLIRRLFRYYLICHHKFSKKKWSIFHSRYEKGTHITFLTLAAFWVILRKKIKKKFFWCASDKCVFQILGHCHFGLCLEITGIQTQTHTHEQTNNWIIY